MDINGRTWISMDNQWIYLDINWYPWMICWYLWISMIIYGLSMDHPLIIHGFPWRSIDNPWRIHWYSTIHTRSDHPPPTPPHMCTQWSRSEPPWSGPPDQVWPQTLPRPPPHTPSLHDRYQATINPKPQTLNPKPWTLNPKPETLNPKP